MRKELTLSHILIKLFCVLLVWFPCQYAFGLAWNQLAEVPPDVVFLGGLYSAAVFGVCLWVAFPMHFLPLGGDNAPGRLSAQGIFLRSADHFGEGRLSAGAGAKLLVFLIALACLVRIWVILAFANPPLSNYGEAHNTAIALLEQGISVFRPHAPTDLATDATALYHTLYPSWALYMLVLKNVYAVFGTSIYVGQYLNVFLTAVIMAALYWLCVRFLKNPGLGLAAAVLFAFWPTSILFCMLHSPDYFTILFVILCLFLWGWTEEKRETFCWWQHLLRLLAVGVSLGILNRFKSVALVVLVALLIYEVVFHLLPAIVQRIREKKAGILAALAQGALTIAAVALFMTGTTKAIDLAIGLNIGHVPQNLTGWFFYSGLTGEDGMWTEQKRDYRDKLLVDYNYDIDAVNRVLMRDTLTELDINTRGTYDMILEKTEAFWQDDLDIYRFMYGGTMNHLYDLIKGSTRVFYMVFLFFMMVGAVGLLLSPICGKTLLDKERRPLLLASLILYGFALMFLVSEMQLRYKFILAAPFALLAGSGAEFLKTLLYRSAYFGWSRLRELPPPPDRWVKNRRKPVKKNRK